MRGGKERHTMRTTNTMESRSSQIIRVTVLTEDHLPGILIDLVILVDVAQDGERKERRNISVIHKNPGSVTVDFERKDVTKRGVIDNAVFADSLVKILTSILELLRQVGFAACFAEHLCRLLQLDSHHGVRRDEEAEDGCVVARPECAADEPSPVVQGVADAG